MDVRFHPKIIEAHVRELQLLVTQFAGHEVVVHLASDQNIAAASTTPAIEFDQQMLLRQCVAETERMLGAQKALYASGPSAYRDIGRIGIAED